MLGGGWTMMGVADGASVWPSPVAFLFERGGWGHLSRLERIRSDDEMWLCRDIRLHFSKTR